MDPERIHAYLQAACAGLGFDIGEVWLSSNESGSTTLAKIEEKALPQNSQSKQRSIRFLQLYTSKSYNSRRDDLLRPTSEDAKGQHTSNNEHSSNEDLAKHVLSPLLVDAISKTFEVVWANCEEREGLLGRSDMRLQTAVGMPVAMDSDGNMCIVVMFSPRKLDTNDDALEYLKFIGQSAVCTSIPCILPVWCTDQKKLIYNPQTFSDWQQPKERVVDQMGHNHSSVKILPLDCNPGTSLTSSHELSSAPKDIYGIPKLPSFAELSNAEKELNHVAASSPPLSDTSVLFDQTTYGVWSTIMASPVDNNELQEKKEFSSVGMMPFPQLNTTTGFLTDNKQGETTNQNSTLSTWSKLETHQREKPVLHPERKERLEEFAGAFLGMSVFDLADVWIPSSDIHDKDTLFHVCSQPSSSDDIALNFFKIISRNTTLRQWSGAVGRAYSTGNPVWSTNQGEDGIVDSERAIAFNKAKIQTAFAIPIFSSFRTTPSCVLCFYSTVRSDSVPFVLKFVQKALRMLWLGLEHIEPHSDVGKDIWSGVAPADLGEMAANTDLQKAFYRKRPIEDISSAVKNELLDSTDSALFSSSSAQRNRSSSLTLQLQSLNMPSEQPSVPLDAKFSTIPVESYDKNGEKPLDSTTRSMTADTQSNDLVTPEVQHIIVSRSGNGPWAYPTGNPTTISTVQDHIQQAVQSVSEVISQSNHYQQANEPAPKRAHLTPTDQIRNFRHDSSHLNNAYQNNQIIQHQVYQNSPDLTSFSNDANQYTKKILPSNTREDPDVVKGYIETFNALVHMNNTQNPIPTPETKSPVTNVRNTSSFLPENHMNNFENGIVTSNVSKSMNPFPDTMLSTSMMCKPVSTPNSTPVIKDVPNGKNCRIDGCSEISVTKRPYCVRHSGNRSCEHPGCTKCAQGATRFCIAHGGGRRCTFPGCDKGARDKFFCAAHGGGKRCSAEGCSKSAVGGSNLCTSHGGGRRCAVEGCNKSAQSSTKFCVKHGGGKKCAHDGCGKVARGRTLYCAAHGGGLRCKLEGCSRIAIGKMQLCRAHGGSSSRSRNNNNTAPVTTQFTYPHTLPTLQDGSISTTHNTLQRG